ncbi:MAG: single-stranded DNA-binding protein [Phycisphaerales bacterium]|nr:single-stranded DNA-binding protein [Phycisphaerales bacterium]
MANFNRVILAGNLTRDPELSHTPSSTAVCKFGIAVNRTWTNKQTNEKHEDVMFIDCVAWSRSAEVINQYCRKGKPLLIEGRLNLDTWTSPEGQKRSKHTVVVESFQFLGGPDGGGQRSESGPRSEGRPKSEDGPRSHQPADSGGEESGDDVPF